MRRMFWTSTALLLATLGAGAAQAELKTTGEGKEQRLDPAQFDSDSRVRYELFAQRCTQCHAMSRPISALTNGKTPISGDTFDREGIKKYVVKMMRKPNSGISREDAKAIVDFLTTARDLAEKAP